jgi:hypothetical protein
VKLLENMVDCKRVPETGVKDEHDCGGPKKKRTAWASAGRKQLFSEGLHTEVAYSRGVKERGILRALHRLQIGFHLCTWRTKRLSAARRFYRASKLNEILLRNYDNHRHVPKTW